MGEPSFPCVCTSVPYSACASALKTRIDKYSFIKQNVILKSGVDLLMLQAQYFANAGCRSCKCSNEKCLPWKQLNAPILVKCGHPNNFPLLYLSKEARRVKYCSKNILLKLKKREKEKISLGLALPTFCPCGTNSALWCWTQSHIF